MIWQVTLFKRFQREDAVIVGRCADYILKDNPDVISVFCYSDVEERIKWSIEEYQVPAKQAKKIVQEKIRKGLDFMNSIPIKNGEIHATIH